MSMFADQLRAARETAGLTQTVAAGRAGIAQPLWSQYERGETMPSVEQAHRLADAVGATLVELLGRGDRQN